MLGQALTPVGLSVERRLMRHACGPRRAWLRNDDPRVGSEASREYDWAVNYGATAESALAAAAAARRTVPLVEDGNTASVRPTASSCLSDARAAQRVE